ncbi:MAG: hypothetical protein LBJ67_04750, partial [Planctomycetaceae bacterium]|nr:hypothetical protein [Planctomycetaceae bacterium]
MKRLFFLFCTISAKHSNLLGKNGIASIQRQHYNQYNMVLEVTVSSHGWYKSILLILLLI